MIALYIDCVSYISLFTVCTAPGVVVHTTRSTSNTEVNITWGPPATPNGVITGYEVFYSVYQNDNTSMTSRRLSGNDRSYPIENLGRDNVCQCVMLFV